MIKVAMHHLHEDGVGEKIGYIFLYDSPDGLTIESLGIPIPRDGEHGMHVHEFGDLMPTQKPNGERVRGGAAGEHYDPQNTDMHLGPYSDGHLGDLPRINVVRGKWTGRVIAPRLRLDDVQDRALIIHSGDDNYSDTPLPNGGGKSRIIGGVITNKCPYCEDPIKTLSKWALGIGSTYLLFKSLE